jgi:hypothetical protein
MIGSMFLVSRTNFSSFAEIHNSGPVPVRRVKCIRLCFLKISYGFCITALFPENIIWLLHPNPLFFFKQQCISPTPNRDMLCLKNMLIFVNRFICQSNNTDNLIQAFIITGASGSVVMSDTDALPIS